MFSGFGLTAPAVELPREPSPYSWTARLSALWSAPISTAVLYKYQSNQGVISTNRLIGARAYDPALSNLYGDGSPWKLQLPELSDEPAEHCPNACEYDSSSSTRRWLFAGEYGEICGRCC